MLVIEELVRGLGLNHWHGDAETILEVGDLEVTGYSRSVMMPGAT